jgi:hypothetical protein
MRSVARGLCRWLGGRRCISMVLLVAYATTAAGVPVSVGTRPRNSGELFPCMASSCGCKTADECWRSCCCHTLAERLAWASKRGVRPPAFVLAKARADGLDLARLTGSSNTCKSSTTCCMDNVDETSCRRTTTSVESLTTQADACCESRHEEITSADEDDRIVAWRSLACRGQSMNWLAAAPTLILVRPDVSQGFPLIARLGPTESDIAGSIADDPAVPPPERAQL